MATERVLGVGLDLVALHRVRALDAAEEWASQVATARECAQWCPGNWGVGLARLWAQKEAVLKALGVGLSRGWPWKQVEIEGGQASLWGHVRSWARAQGVGRVLVGFAQSQEVVVGWAVALGNSPLQQRRTGTDFRACGLSQEAAMDEQMKKTIIDYVRREYLEDDTEEITEDTPLISGGIVDSFSMVSLKRFLEKTYGVHIPDAEASSEAFDTVRGIVELVKRHMGK